MLFEALPADWLAPVRRLGCVAAVLHHALVTPDRVAAAHAEGCRLLAYTVNDPATVCRLIAAGVDGIITDAVDRFAP